MNNLILIGNGFDLAHGMKTGYTDFIEYMVNEHCEDRSKYGDLFDLPGEINSFEDFMSESDKFKPSHFRNNFFVFSLIKELSQNKWRWCDVESHYYTLLLSIGKDDLKYVSSLYNDPNLLNKHFQVFKNQLEKYLKKEEENVNAVGSYTSMFKMQNLSKTCILNFNYTHTVQNLYGESIKGNSIIHIHGELEDAHNPIVFGYAAYDGERKELIGKDENEYMRNIKKYQYKRANQERRLLEYLDNTPTIDVSILGHSCGLSDKLILSEIFNHKNINSIQVFYYKNDESHFNSIVNIDRIADSNKTFEKVINYEDSFRMPQHDDWQIDAGEFSDHIRNKLYEQRRPQREVQAIYNAVDKANDSNARRHRI